MNPDTPANPKSHSLRRLHASLTQLPANELDTAEKMVKGLRAQSRLFPIIGDIAFSTQPSGDTLLKGIKITLTGKEQYKNERDNDHVRMDHLMDYYGLPYDLRMGGPGENPEQKVVFYGCDEKPGKTSEEAIRAIVKKMNDDFAAFKSEGRSATVKM